MSAPRFKLIRLFLLSCAGLIGFQVTSANIEWHEPAQGGKTYGVARLTHDFTVRDWGNYHNALNWSHQGRYLAYTRYASDEERFGRAPEVHVIDLHTGEDTKLGPGQSPRWANHHDWLFYARDFRDEEGDRSGEVRWYDLDSKRDVQVGTGVNVIGGVSADDQWLLGGARLPEGAAVRSLSIRMRIQENSLAEYLPGLDAGSQWIPNPVHDVAFTRVPNRDDEPFYPTRFWYALDGSNIQVGSVTLTRCHQAWTGDGTYFLLGNSQVRGRLWDQPFPSSLHFLAAVGTGDVSPCGRNGRFVVGDKPLTFVDLRSGDGWNFLEDLSIICYPDNISDDSGPYDSDMKGSPDGTKVNFVSNYDLIAGPVTKIVTSAGESTHRLEVESTAMFPESGALVVNREVVGYERKTPTSFEGLTRKLYHTYESGLRKGGAVTSFEARTISQKQWENLPLPLSAIERSMGGLKTPLVRQNSTDLWSAVVRLPDRPWLRVTESDVQLIPGESHYETFGYHLYRDGQRLTDRALRPGEERTLEAGEYACVAVEWSGLESPRSQSLNVSQVSRLRILHEKPADFSWLQDAWMVDGKAVSLDKAMASVEATKEIHHRYDGLIGLEWYRWGEVQKRHDLNVEGKAIRRLTFHRGLLFKREYHDRDSVHVSTEYLDAAGNVTEMIRFRSEDGTTGSQEYDHWWYENGMPVKRIGRAPARRIDSKTPVMYIKSGEQWLKQDYVGTLPVKNKRVESYSHDRARAEVFQQQSTVRK